MSLQGHRWYNANSARGFPLDDNATGLTDQGVRLPSDILVDCRLRFPDTLGQYAYVGSLTTTARLVTLLLLATDQHIRPPRHASSASSADATPAGYTPLAALTVTKPIVEGRPYALTPLAPGVGGWVVLGNADETFVGRFSTPEQSLLLPRCAQAYRPLPVASLSKLGIDTELTGVVRLVAGQDVQIVKETRNIAGIPRDAVVIRLANNLNRNVYDRYRGPCGGRPESETCAREPIAFINTVSPDCNGDITIEFESLLATPHDDGHGVTLDFALGLSDTCTNAKRLPDADGKLPSEYTDLCDPGGVDPPPDDDSSLSDDAGSESSESSESSISEEPIPLEPLPYLETFNDQLAQGFVVVSGTFVFDADDSPEEPVET